MTNNFNVVESYWLPHLPPNTFWIIGEYYIFLFSCGSQSLFFISFSNFPDLQLEKPVNFLQYFIINFICAFSLIIPRSSICFIDDFIDLLEKEFMIIFSFFLIDPPKVKSSNISEESIFLLIIGPIAPLLLWSIININVLEKKGFNELGHWN